MLRRRSPIEGEFCFFFFFDFVAWVGVVEWTTGRREGKTRNQILCRLGLLITTGVKSKKKVRERKKTITANFCLTTIQQYNNTTK